MYFLLKRFHVSQQCTPIFQLFLACVIFFFYFLITYGICKNRKYCNRKIKNKILLSMNIHVLYVLERKNSKKNAVCLYVCMYVGTSVCMSRQ